MRYFAIITSAMLASCGFNGGGLNSPVNLPQGNQACLVQVHAIKPVHGYGWVWVQTEPQGFCGAGPVWSMNPHNENLYVWHLDPTIAYFGGEAGFYRVTATYEFGFGQTDLEIVHE